MCVFILKEPRESEIKKRIQGHGEKEAERRVSGEINAVPVWFSQTRQPSRTLQDLSTTSPGPCQLGQHCRAGTELRTSEAAPPHVGLLIGRHCGSAVGRYHLSTNNDRGLTPLLS